MKTNIAPLDRLNDLPSAQRVVTIGTFDGVHLGHQALVAAAAARAAELRLTMAAITFDPAPMAVLKPERFPGNILSVNRKVEFLRSAGADDIVVLPFTTDLAAVTAQEFLATLVDLACVQELYVGEEFALGHNREGTIDVLQRLGDHHGVRVVAITRIEDSGVIVSSSAIREALRTGEVKAASRMLGRFFQIQGEVIHGAHVGRTIGYPTANVLPPEDHVQLADGIYASLTTLPGESSPLPSMTYIGTRPALNTGRRLIETHLLDFNGDLYGQLITVDILERLRADADFPSLDALISQLQRDEAATRRVLMATDPPPQPGN